MLQTFLSFPNCYTVPLLFLASGCLVRVLREIVPEGFSQHSQTSSSFNREKIRVIVRTSNTLTKRTNPKTSGSKAKVATHREKHFDKWSGDLKH